MPHVAIEDGRHSQCVVSSAMTAVFEIYRLDDLYLLWRKVCQSLCPLASFPTGPLGHHNRAVNIWASGERYNFVSISTTL